MRARPLLYVSTLPGLVLWAAAGGWNLYERIRPRLTRRTLWHP